MRFFYIYKGFEARYIKQFRETNVPYFLQSNNINCLDPPDPFLYIERGLHSRTEKIGEREINGSAVHNIGAVGNRTISSCLPPPPLHNLRRGVICSPTSLSPLTQFEAAAVDLEDGL
jgi:hypothetical protein